MSTKSFYQAPYAEVIGLASESNVCQALSGGDINVNPLNDSNDIVNW